MKTEVKVLIAGAILFSIIIVIFNLAGNNGAIYEKGAFVVQPTASVKILSQGLEDDDDGNLFITGVAQNIGSVKLNYTEIDGEFYNKAGNLLTKSFDKITEFEPNQTWRFKMVYNRMDSYDVATYNISIGSIW